MNARARALVFLAGGVAFAAACALPALSAPGRHLNGFEFVQAALRAIPNAELMRAWILGGALAANVLVPLCALMTCLGRGGRVVRGLCAVPLALATFLCLQAMQSNVITLHVGVAVWFVAMSLMAVVALSTRA